MKEENCEKMPAVGIEYGLSGYELGVLPPDLTDDRIVFSGMSIKHILLL